VRDLIAEYRKEREALRGKESTHRKYGLLFRAMKEVWGDDMPVQAIGRSQCIELLSFLKRVPPNVGKRFPRLSLTRAVAKADAEGLPGLAPNTVGSYMQGLVAILRWATDADWGVKVNRLLPGLDQPASCPAKLLKMLRVCWRFGSVSRPAISAERGDTYRCQDRP
jgi:hypothetical protein